MILVCDVHDTSYYDIYIQRIEDCDDVMYRRPPQLYSRQTNSTTTAQ